MPNLLRTEIEGHLGQDPRWFKYGPNKDKDGCQLNIATSIGPKDNKETVWSKVVVYGWSTDQCRHMTKGSAVHVLSLKPAKVDKWDDKDGNAHHEISYVAQSVHLIAWVKKGEAVTQVSPEAGGSDLAPLEGDDNLPF